MRMTASWSGRYGSTEYKVVARYFAPDGKLPLGPLCCPSKKITGARSKSALTENAPYKACSAFTRVAACTLALPPIRDTLSEGFSYFVTSIAAPVASGWSVAGWDLHPLESAALSRRTPKAVIRLVVTVVEPSYLVRSRAYPVERKCAHA